MHAQCIRRVPWDQSSSVFVFLAEGSPSSNLVWVAVDFSSFPSFRFPSSLSEVRLFLWGRPPRPPCPPLNFLPKQKKKREITVPEYKYKSIYFEKPLNPLHLKISVYILDSVLNTFPWLGEWELDKENLFNQELLECVVIVCILITSMFVQYW